MGQAADCISDGRSPELPASASTAPPADRWVGVYAATALGVLVVRLSLVLGRDAAWWQDSDDYLDMSKAPWWSLDLWAGGRTPAVPVLLKLVAGDPQRFMYAQIVVAALCWAALVTEIVRRTRSGWPLIVVVAATVGLSLADPLTMWDRSVLTESLAISGLALLAAALMRFARDRSWRGAALLVGATAFWCATRDTHAWIVLLSAAGGAVWVVGRPQLRQVKPILVAVVAAAILASLTIVASRHGERDDFPLRNVYQVRVLPYPDRVAWFADHGMPQAEQFLDGGARPPYERAGAAPVTYASEDDALLEQWSAWLESDGQRTFILWVLTHPSYAWSEPLEDPERAFNNADGDRSFYAPVDRRSVTGIGSLLMPNRGLTLLVAGGTLSWVIWRRRPTSAPLIVGAGLVALALPHALLSWHADGMETARHLVMAVVQLHLGVVLIATSLAVATSQASKAPDVGCEATEQGDPDVATS